MHDIIRGSEEEKLHTTLVTYKPEYMKINDRDKEVHTKILYSDYKIYPS